MILFDLYNAVCVVTCAQVIVCAFIDWDSNVVQSSTVIIMYEHMACKKHAAKIKKKS